MGNIVRANIITMSKIPIRIDFFLYLSTKYFKNLETKNEAIKLKTQNTTTSNI